MIGTAEELRKRAELFRTVREAGLRERRRPPEDDGIPVGTIPLGANKELRLTWYADRDRAPLLRIRVWDDNGTGFYPVSRVGVSIPFMHLDKFGAGVATALDLATRHQENLRRSGGRR